MVTRSGRAVPDAVRAALAAAVAILLGCLAACGSTEGRSMTPVVPASAASSSGTRVHRWDAVRFDLPAIWTVHDTGEVHPHPSGALVEGPYLGTLATGSMCFLNRDGSGGCSRAHGILQRRPLDGIVAWIDGAPLRIPGTDVDPGSAAADTCPPHGLTFHAYRSLPTPDGRYRVSLDGCAYGAHAQDYLAQLRAVADSLRAA